VIYSGRGPKDFTPTRLTCYLAIASYMSQVFSEVRPLATLQDAQDIPVREPDKGSMRDLLDMQLLAAWLNFANGSIGYTELVDTNGDGTPDTAFNVAMAAAEAVRLNPASTDAQLEQQKNILERINLRNGG